MNADKSVGVSVMRGRDPRLKADERIVIPRHIDVDAIGSQFRGKKRCRFDGQPFFERPPRSDCPAVMSSMSGIDDNRFIFDCASRA